MFSTDRGVHGSSGSGLCPTCNQPIRDRVGRFSTRNWPVKRVEFRGSVCQRVASVSGEAETWRKTQKNGQNRLDLVQSSEDFFWFGDFPPNRAENCQIWCIYAGSNCFGRQNLPNQAENLSQSLENSPKFDVFGQVKFHGFWTRGLETDPSALGFGARDPRPTARAIGSGER